MNENITDVINTLFTVLKGSQSVTPVISFRGKEVHLQDYYLMSMPSDKIDIKDLSPLLPRTFKVMKSYKGFEFFSMMDDVRFYHYQHFGFYLPGIEKHVDNYEAVWHIKAYLFELKGSLFCLDGLPGVHSVISSMDNTKLVTMCGEVVDIEDLLMSDGLDRCAECENNYDIYAHIQYPSDFSFPGFKVTA